MFGLKKRHRLKLMQQSLSYGQMAILKKTVPHISHLPEHLQSKLQGLTTIFLDEKRFEGCAGLEITDEIRLTIAAQACILLLGIDDLSSFYEELRSVLVYPKSYVAKVNKKRDNFFVEEGFVKRFGEAWSRGHIILAWDEVKKGASDIQDGQNLVFHEFAHQLDYEYGATDTVDEPAADSSLLAWARAIGNEYDHFIQALEHHQPTPIDDYGAKSPAEFFAVVTECFFEKSLELRARHPRLYEQFTEFYKQDPAAYIQSKE